MPLLPNQSVFLDLDDDIHSVGRWSINLLQHLIFSSTSVQLIFIGVSGYLSRQCWHRHSQVAISKVSEHLGLGSHRLLLKAFPLWNIFTWWFPFCNILQPCFPLGWFQKVSPTLCIHAWTVMNVLVQTWSTTWVF